MIVQLKAINKSFETDYMTTRALSNINLAVSEGEYVAIEGPSGCGKSTLLSIVGLLDTPSSGEMFLAGKCVSDLSHNSQAYLRNQLIGFIFQNFNLIGDLTVQENVELPLTIRGVASRERRDRASEVLERVGILERARHFPSQLSGGQQQRAAVARALVGSPKVLLADEPTGNLDSDNGEAVMDLLSSLHKSGMTIIMVTHDIRFNRRVSRSVSLKDGSIVA